MRLKPTLFSVLMISVLSATGGYADPPQSDVLQVNELKDAYELWVPAEGVIMTIPRGGLSQKKMRGGSMDSPRYFYFQDEAPNLIVSGWFESRESCTWFWKAENAHKHEAASYILSPEEHILPGIKDFWMGEMKAMMHHGVPKPRDVSFEKLDDWSAIVYDIPLPAPLSAECNSNIRAEGLWAGTWIDIHISLTSDRPPAGCRAKLVTFLKTIQVNVKQ